MDIDRTLNLPKHVFWTFKDHLATCVVDPKDYYHHGLELYLDVTARYRTARTMIGCTSELMRKQHEAAGLLTWSTELLQDVCLWCNPRFVNPYGALILEFLYWEYKKGELVKDCQGARYLAYLKNQLALEEQIKERGPAPAPRQRRRSR